MKILVRNTATKKHHLTPCSAPKGSINGHSAFYCSVNKITITSNNDVIGDKWYLTNGEQGDTIWYSSPTVAAIAYFEHGVKAVNKTARRYD